MQRRHTLPTSVCCTVFPNLLIKNRDTPAPVILSADEFALTPEMQDIVSEPPQRS
jgi:hypothetical protein